jgi:hypothetical protein
MKPNKNNRKDHFHSVRQRQITLREPDRENHYGLVEQGFWRDWLRKTFGTTRNGKARPMDRQIL